MYSRKAIFSIFGISLFISVIIGSYLTFYSGDPSTPVVAEVQSGRPQVLGMSGGGGASRSNRPPQMFVYGGDYGFASGGIISMASTDEPTLSLSSYNISGDAVISVYNSNIDNVLNYLVHDEDNQQLSKEVDTSSMELVGSTTHFLQTSENSNTFPLPIEGRGIWYVTIQVQNTFVDGFIIRSDNGAVVKEGKDNFVFWGQNFSTLRTTGRGSLKLLDLKDRITEVARTSYSSEGIAETGLSSRADLAIMDVDGDISLIPLNLQYLNAGYGFTPFTEPSTNSKYFIFTDRPIYEPGQTVQFKAIIRTDEDARYTTPSGSAKVTISTGDKDIRFESSYPISPDGSISGSYVLPDSSSVGTYTLTIDVGSVQSNFFWGEYSSNYTLFRVEHYQKPESFLSVDTSQIEYISGDNVRVNISGTYFSGQPLIGTDLKYRVTATDFYEYDLAHDAQQYSTSSLDSYYGNWYGSTVIAEGTVSLDNRGEAQVDIDTRQIDNPEEYSSYTKGQSKIFIIEVTQEDGSLVPSYSRKNILVYAGDYGIYRTTYSSSGKVGSVYQMPIKLSPYFRQSNLAGIALTATITRTSWIRDSVQTQKYPTYKEIKEDLAPINVKTNSVGETDLSFTPRAQGSYKILVEGYDSSGNYITKQFYAYISSQDTPNYSGPEAAGLSLTLDRDQYDPADSPELTIVSDIPDRDLFLTFERGRLDRYQIVRLNGKSDTITLDLKPTDMPNMYVAVSSFNNFGLDVAQLNLPVSAASKKLTVTIEPGSLQYQPGDNISVTVTTKDSQGQPVSAEIALWAVDKAIFELADSSLGNIFDTFWSMRGDSTQDAHSLMGIQTQQAEGGGGGGDSRTIFKDTAYWNPDIKTNAQGQATVKFKLPDNLTTWTLAAVGATSQTQVGQSTKEIMVTKDLIVRPILPNIMRIGDKVYLSALLQNFSSSAHPFQVQLSFDSGDVTQNTWQNIQLDSMASAELEWELTPTKLNDQAKLTFIAKSEDGSNLSDTIEVSLPVKRFGFLESVGQSQVGTHDYSLNLVDEIDPEQSSIKVTLASSLFGTLPSVMDYLVGYAYGCVEQTVSRLVPALLVAENDNLFGSQLEDKNLDKIVEKSLERIASMQRGDGGWTWWYTGKSDPFITRYVVENLGRAEKQGYKLKSGILERAQNYLKDQASPQALEVMEPDILALAVIGNYQAGDQNPTSNGLKRLMSLAQSQGDAYYWSSGAKERFGSVDTSTALALRALITAKADREYIDKAVLYLTRSRQDGHWGNTYATAQIMNGLVEYAKLSSDLRPNFSYQITLDSSKLSSGSISSPTLILDEILIPPSKIKEGGSTIGVTQSGDGNLFSSLLVSQFLTSYTQPSINRGISISKRFENVKGPEYAIGAGDTVNVFLTVSGLLEDDKYGVITDELPSGMVPVNTSLRNEQGSWSFPEDYETSFNITDLEFTENGVVMSLYNVSNQEQTYSYKARVVSAGVYNVPPATVSLMYAPEIHGRTATSQIELSRSQGTHSGSLTNKFIFTKQVWQIIGMTVVGVSLAALLTYLYKRRRRKLLERDQVPPHEL